MSIPKEPRQLMITLMYLVLMALLALNVSAEIMNAFFDLDKSLHKSAEIASKGADDSKAGIQAILDKKPQLKPVLNTAIEDAKTEVDAFVESLTALKVELVDQSSGGNRDGVWDENDEDPKTHKPKGKKDKDVTTRLLVKEGKGDSLASNVLSLKAKLAAIFEKAASNPVVKKETKKTDKEIADAIESVKNAIALEVESLEEIQKKAPEKKSWAEYKFKKMPLAAALPAITKYEADARNAQATITYKLAEFVGGREIKLNSFFPIMNAKKGYIIKGEKFEAEVAIGAFSSEFAKSASISVDGQRVSLNSEGKGTFTQTTSSYGEKTLRMTATVKNPLTGEVMNGKSEFKYEVGERSATVSADKMNVFYVGVPNPISIAVAGANSNKINVRGKGCTVSGSNGKYSVTASRPTNDAGITVSAPGISKTFPFRVKRIPDPKAKLTLSGTNQSGGQIGNGEFKAYSGVIAHLENFDFDAKCQIQGFNLTRQAKRADPITVANLGYRYATKASNLVQMAKPGDVYYFDNVKAKCPGDSAGRKINPMVWKIK